MLKVLIIEDEHLAARRLIRLLKDIEPDVQILATLDSVKSSVEWLEGNQADLIFLDIHLADGNSFSIFDQIPVNTPIIFSTAYDQYAIRAFKVNSVDYLLKPIEKEELAQSLKKFHQARPTEPKVDITALAQALLGKKTAEYQKRFMVMTGDKIKSVPVEDVAYFFGQQKYVFLITRDNRRHIIDTTLSVLEESLDPTRFYRINRQFIIGFDSIVNMVAYSKSRVKVELNPPSDIEAIVSIEKSKSFKDWLNG
ncbi:MAG: LytTR family DNA-binding domain-containing protein [Bacteroidia bacterium]|nr:LytTR family DNA-binding domain-containing protein [Bacteroidia bacterium]